MSAVSDRLTAALAGTYRLDRELGAGGMATVFLAHDLKHQRDVAIKVLHPDLGAALGGERFLSEIRTTARLQHPHILPLLDSGEADGLLYYVMPLVTGETLRARLERERQLPVADAVRIAREVAGALDYAHRQSVIHRDIKPENILLQDGAAVVADFGIALAVQSAGGARMTQTGLSLGTPQYMSPEQAMGERTIDARSDIYALGAVTYEMLTGDPPFTGSSVQAVVAKVINAEPERPSLTRKAVGPALEAGVLRALEKLPADRFATAAEFATAIAQESSATTTTTVRPSTVSAPSRRPMIAITLLAMLLAGVGGWFARGSTTDRAVSSTVVTPRRLTHAGNVGCVGLAPGAQQFALVVGSYTDETQCSGALVIRPTPTGPDRIIVPSISHVSMVQWSPTGDGILAVGAPEGKPIGAWWYPTKAGTPRQLWTGPLTAAGYVDSGHVFVVTPAVSSGTMQRPLLRVLDALSGQQTDSTRIPPHRGGTVSMSANARWIAAVTPGTRAQLVLVARDGHVSDSAATVIATQLVWLGDTALVYQRRPDLRPGELVRQRVNPSSGEFVGLPEVIVSGLPPLLTLSSDASSGTLLWTTAAITDELHRVPLGSAANSTLFTRSRNAFLGDPTLSPDGGRVAYSREDALGTNVYLRDLSTGVEQTVSSDTLSSGEVFWPSPQHVMRTTASDALTSFDLATGRSRRFNAPAGERIVSARANTWLFVREVDGAVVRRDSTLGSPRTITSSGLRDALGALSPDGRQFAEAGRDSSNRFAFAVYDDARASWSAVTSIDTISRRVTNIANDGTIYFTRFNGRTELWRAKVGGPLVPVTLPPVQCYEGSITVNDRGDQLFCNLTTNTPDAYMVTLTKTKR